MSPDNMNSALIEDLVNEINLRGFMRTLHTDSHVVIDETWRGVFLDGNAPLCSLSLDLRTLPRRRNYLTVVPDAGRTADYLRQRFPKAEVVDLFGDYIPQAVWEKSQKNKARPWTFEGRDPARRPVVILFTPRSGGNLVARYLNAKGLVPMAIPVRAPLEVASIAGYGLQSMLDGVAARNQVDPRDLNLLVNTQFLGRDSGLEIDLAGWVMRNDALMVSVRREINEQAQSLAAAISTDIWEYWGRERVDLDNIPLRVDENRKLLQKEVAVFDRIEDMMPAHNFIRVHYSQMLADSAGVAQVIARRTHRTYVDSDPKDYLPSRLRGGVEIRT